MPIDVGVSDMVPLSPLVKQLPVLPWQGLGSLTTGLDALDLVAVHDQLVLLPNFHVVLETAMHRVISW